MARNKNKSSAAKGGATSNKVGISFKPKNFRHKGKVYESAVVEEAANAEEPWALELVAHLVKINSGIIKVVAAEVETKTEE